MFPLFCPTLVQAIWIMIFIQKKSDRTLSVFRIFVLCTWAEELFGAVFPYRHNVVWLMPAAV
jgi:hypothetical protein